MQQRFAERFGVVKHALVISNTVRAKDGTLTLQEEDDTREKKWHKIQAGSRTTEGWHSDVTFTPVSVKMPHRIRPTTRPAVTLAHTCTSHPTHHTY